MNTLHSYREGRGERERERERESERDKQERFCQHKSKAQHELGSVPKSLNGQSILPKPLPKCKYNTVRVQKLFTFKIQPACHLSNERGTFSGTNYTTP